MARRAIRDPLHISGTPILSVVIVANVITCSGVSGLTYVVILGMNSLVSPTWFHKHNIGLL
jgi:hypothetical protein